MIRNQFVGVGRFVNDLEIKEYDNFKVLEFSIAIDNSYQKDGEWVNNSHFFNCKCFDKVAESIVRRFAKGDKVQITGKLTTEKFTPKDSDREVTKFLIKVDNAGLIAKANGNLETVPENTQAVDESLPF